MDVAIGGAPAVSVVFNNFQGEMNLYEYQPNFTFGSSLRNYQASGLIGATPLSLRPTLEGGISMISPLGGGLCLPSSCRGSADFFPEICLDHGGNWGGPSAFTTEPVPEPARMVLLASAAALAAATRLRRHQ